MKISLHTVLLTPLLAIALFATTVSALEVKAEKVADGVHALIGPTTARTHDNHGLNANFGVIDTAEGTVLIDSGASVEGAKLLERQVVALTGKPVRWVINTGAQDHRWLGNGYFRSKGIEVIALSRTVESQQKYGLAQLDSLRPVLKERLDGTDPVTASRKIDGDVARLQLGGRNIELRYFADAHFAGDAVVWLPAERIAFAGDHVYVDRLLGILPQSNAETWLVAFNALMALQPALIVPGHGSVANPAKAQADTGDYLAFVVSGVKALAEDMAGVDEAVEKLGDAPQFARLANFDELHRGNVSRAYLRIEAGQ